MPELTPDEFLKQEQGLTPDEFLKGESSRKEKPLRGMEKLGALPDAAAAPLPNELQTPAAPPAPIAPKIFSDVPIQGTELDPRTGKPLQGKGLIDTKKIAPMNLAPESPADKGHQAIADFVDNTILGKGTAKPDYGAIGELAKSALPEGFDKPLLDPEKVTRELGFFFGGPQSLRRGIATGLVGLATPENVAIAAGTEGIGALGAVGKSLQLGAEAYFAAQGAKSAGKHAARAYEQAKAGDLDGFFYETGLGSVDSALTLALARATMRGSKAAAAEIKTAIDARARIKESGSGPGAGPGAPDSPIEPPQTPPEAPKLQPNAASSETPAIAETAAGGAAPVEPAPAEPAESTGSYTETDQTGRQTQTKYEPAPPEASVKLLDHIVDSMNQHLLDRIVDEQAGKNAVDQAVERQSAGEPAAPKESTPLTPEEFKDLFGDWKPKEPAAGEPGPVSNELPTPVSENPGQKGTPEVSAHQVDTSPENVPEGQLGDFVPVKTSKGDEVNTRYTVSEAKDLVASHDDALNPNPDYPQELQPRDRQRAASRTQVDEITAKLDPSRLAANPMADRGAPITVRRDNKQFVISGNARTIALKRGNEAYKQWLIDNADEFGLDPETIRGMQAPILHRDLQSNVDLVDFAKQANEDDKARMGATEVARGDAERLTPEVMKIFNATDEGDIVHPGNRDFVRVFMDKVVPKGERGELMTKDGAISQAGITRIRNAVFAKAYGADSAALEKLSESPDSNIRNITTGMLHAAPVFAAMRDGIDSGDLHNLDLTREISDAAAKMSALRESGQTVKGYLQQIGMFGNDLSPEARSVLDVFQQYRGSGKKIGAVLRNYAAGVEAVGNPKQAGMFGSAVPTRGEVLEAAITATEKQYAETPTPQSGSLFEDQPAGGSSATGETDAQGKTPGNAERGAEHEPARKPAGSPDSGRGRGTAGSGEPETKEVKKTLTRKPKNTKLLDGVKARDEKIIREHSGKPIETKVAGEIPEPLPEEQVRRLKGKPDNTAKAARTLVGGFTRAYGGGIDEIVSVADRLNGLEYTVRDTETGKKRTHRTFIDPRRVTFKPSPQSVPVLQQEAVQRSGGGSEEESGTAEARLHRGVIWANPSALTAMSEALGVQPFNGVNVSLHYARKLASGLRRAGHENLANLVQEAAAPIRENPLATVTIVGLRPGRTLSELKETSRHEQFHGTQYAIAAGQASHVDEARFLAHPLAADVVDRLGEYGYDTTNEVEIAAEIGARLAAGPLAWKSMGLDRKQAESLFSHYVQLLRERHGKKVLFALTRISPKLNEVLDAERKRESADVRQTGDSENLEAGGSPGKGKLSRGIREDIPAGEQLRFARPEPLTLRTETRSEEVTRRQTPEERRPKPLARNSALSKVVDGMAETRDEIQKVFNPTARSSEAERTGLALRAHAAREAREFAKAEEALAQARKYFATRTWEENLAFINQVENPTPSGQDSPEMQAAADLMRELLDSQRKEVQALGTGKLTAFYENYFPHVWAEPEKAALVMKQIFGKRPIEGSKGFLKQRTLQSFQEGIDRGLKPVSENPVDLVLLKLKEMGRYLLAHRFLQEMKASGLAKYGPARGGNITRDLQARGWVKIVDPIGTVYGNPEIQVPEAMDKQMVEALAQVAKAIGVEGYRVAKMRNAKHWGIAYPGRKAIVTKFAGPESVIIHEIGHMLDARFGLAEQLVKHPNFRQELADLADLRLTGGEPPSYARYVRKGSEKIANMVAAYVHAPSRFREVAPRTFAWFDRFVKNTPELKALEDARYGMQLKVTKTGIDTGALLIRGHYYMPEPAAHLVANFLSPGLNGKAWYRALRGAGNTMLQFSLGFSAYHLGFTSFDAATSKLAIAVKYAADGKPLQALQHIAQVPISPIANVIKGHKVRQAYLSDSIHDPELARYAEAIEQGGGRVKMEEQYRTKFRQRIVEAWHKADAAGVALNLPGAVTEAIAMPIMEWLVPRQKLGVFADMAAFELQRLGPDASKEEVRRAMANAWDSVDNRMGQMVYDNLFWNKIAKDLAMVSVQSLGWNLGTFYELGGGARDWVKAASNGGKKLVQRGGGGNRGGGIFDGGGDGGDEGLERGRADADFTHKMAYTVALPLLTGFLGAIVTYLATGHGPEDDRDYFFPRNGNFNPDGTAQRISFPSYMKDVYHWREHPGAAAAGKLNPILRSTYELLSNHDWRNVEIRNPKDPAYQQALDVGKHVAKQFVPFAVGNLRDARSRGEGATNQALPFVGVTTAPSYITKSKAEQRISELLAARMPAGAQTKESFEKKSLRRELVQGVKKHDPTVTAKAKEALAAGKISPKELMTTLRDGAKDSSLARFNALNAEEAIEVYQLGSETEKAKWRGTVVKKVLGLADKSPGELNRIKERFGAVLKEIAAAARKKAS